jgi:hypothetical protein
MLAIDYANIPPARGSVDLNKAIYALSDALDLVGIDDIGHCKRVGVMAEACARTLRVADIFQAMVQDRPYRRGLSAEAVLTADIQGAMSAALPGIQNTK